MLHGEASRFLESTRSSAYSYLQDDQSLFKCQEQVETQLPGCEHRALLYCFQDPAQVSCQSSCHQPTACCQKLCESPCGDCQLVSTAAGTRDKHRGHRCDRILPCQHACLQICDEDHKDVCGTTECRAGCLQSCRHRICPLGCSQPCEPCVMPCPWQCEHYKCTTPCGLVSSLIKIVKYLIDFALLALCTSSL